MEIMLAYYETSTCGCVSVGIKSYGHDEIFWHKTEWCGTSTCQCPVLFTTKIAEVKERCNA